MKNGVTLPWFRWNLGRGVKKLLENGNELNVSQSQWGRLRRPRPFLADAVETTPGSPPRISVFFTLSDSVAWRYDYDADTVANATTWPSVIGHVPPAGYLGRETGGVFFNHVVRPKCVDKLTP